MSALATAAILRAEGVEPIVHMTTRDRNRIALMSDVLGAQALGLRSFLCTSGDHQALGRERASRNVFDLDSIQLLSVLDHLRREGVLFGDGRKVGPCDLYLGATASPFGEPPEPQVIRLAKKVKAGADFLVTQPVFDVEAFARWLESVRPMGVVAEAAVLVGVLAPPSADRARDLNETSPGMRIPDAVIERIGAVALAKQRGEAIALAAELIGRLRGLEGVRGVYLMTEGDNAATVEVIEKAGLNRERRTVNAEV